MGSPASFLDNLPEEAVWQIDEICGRFEESWQANQRPRLEDFVSGTGGYRLALLRELLLLDVYYRRQAGETPTAQDYASRFPEAAGLLHTLFAALPEDGAASAVPGADTTTDDVQRTGPYLGAGQIVGNETVANEGPASRFQRRRFHAAGGLGEVFVAEDQELHREVALKEIKQKYADMSESRDRFVLEAEITGKLEHPGVVPVYGLGTYPDGRPYYAMRFIKGDTLATAIKQFHTQTPVRFDSLDFRQLLGRLVAVCQAVAYAHSRGVLHRDIKPGNIMLGKFGETLVVDWGLAKIIGRPDGDTAGHEGLLRPSGRGVQATVGVVGTPAYMSPEQAAGKVEELSPTTDVYSLGATLYELVTNRAPFKGPMVEVIKQVERGEWQPPRQVNGAVPPALDAICRKAMSWRPEERYVSALALAEDLEHWLGDEPVEAYPEPRGVRLRRWMRKHPRRVTAAVVSLIALVVVLAVGLAFMRRSNQAMRASLNMVEGQADYFISEVSNNLLLNEPGMQGLRRRILLKAVDDYANFLKKWPGDPHARQQLAGTKRQLGELYAQYRMNKEARALVLQAVEEYEGLWRETPTDKGLRFGLAQSRYLLGDLYLQSGQLEEGEAEVKRSIKLLKELEDEGWKNTTCMVMLARCFEFRARAGVQQGNTESGLANNLIVLELLVTAYARLPSFADRTALWETYRMENHGFLASERPTGMYEADRLTSSTAPPETAWRRVLMLGRAYTNQGIWLNLTGRNGEAARMLEEAIAVHRMLLEQNAQTGQLRHGLALALLHSGRVMVQLGLPGRAEADLREALGLMLHLVQIDPYLVEFRATRLLAARCLGETLLQQGRTVAAAELLREAVKEGKKDLDHSPKDRNLQEQHARLLHVLGSLEVESGNLDRGLGVCLRAHQELEQVLHETPGDRSLTSDWLTNREMLARCRSLKGALSRNDWIKEQRAILKERQTLVGQGNPAPRFQRDVAGSAAILAGLLLEANHPAEALACVDAVLATQEQLVVKEQERVKAAVKEKQENGAVPAQAGRQDHSLQLFLRQTAIVPDHSLYRQWATLLARRGAALVRLGRDAEASEAVRQAVEITDGILRRDLPLHPPPASPVSPWAFLPNPIPPASQASLWAFLSKLWPVESCHLYDLSCHQALASTLPGANGRPDPAEQAVFLLRCCIASGFDNHHQLRTDPALEPLRQRQDFQKLVHDLAARSPGRKDASTNR